MDELAASPPSSTKPARITWPGGPSKKQSFSFSSSIIYYILKNPSTPEVYIKLIKSCKYFFENNPVLVVERMHGSTICSNDDCKSEAEDDECCVKIDISKISSKIWLTKELSLDEDRESDFASLLCQKLFRNDAYCLSIFDKAIMFDDFKVLASPAGNIFLSQVKIIYEEGKEVFLENIVDAVNAEHFTCTYSNNSSTAITASTMKKLSQLKNFEQIKSFLLWGVPEIVKVEDVSNLIKDHENISFQLLFNRDLSDGYKQQLGDLVDSIIESNIPNRIVLYNGHDLEKFEIMKARCFDEEIIEIKFVGNGGGEEVSNFF